MSQINKLYTTGQLAVAINKLWAQVCNLSKTVNSVPGTTITEHEIAIPNKERTVDMALATDLPGSYTYLQPVVVTGNPDNFLTISDRTGTVITVSGLSDGNILVFNSTS